MDVNILSKKNLGVTFFIGLLSLTSFAQNNVTLQKGKRKQKVVDLDKVFAIDTDVAFYEGRVVGHDGLNFQMAIPSDSGGKESIYNIPVSSVNGLWLCPRSTDEKCTKWKSNQGRNDVLIVSAMAPLFVGNLVAIATNRIRLSLAIVSGMAVIFSSYATINNPKRMKLNQKWTIIS